MANQNQDVFGIDSRIGGAWSLDGAVIIIDTGDDAEADGDPDTPGAIGDLLIVNSIDVSYVRRSQKFSPLNQNRKYLAIGEADGTIQMGLIVGPHAAIKDFLRKFSNPCNLKTNMITVNPAGLRRGVNECAADFEEIYFKCSGCIINTLTISVRQSGSVLTVVNAGIGLQFISLEVGPTNNGQRVEAA